MESKIPVWVGVFVCLGVVLGGLVCWVFFNIYALFMLSGDLGGPWGLDRTSVDSSESTLHRTEFSLFELYLIFSLTKKKN